MGALNRGCPFCGARGELLQGPAAKRANAGKDWRDMLFMVRCEQCGATRCSAESPAVAWDAWNERASDRYRALKAPAKKSERKRKR